MWAKNFSVIVFLLFFSSIVLGYAKQHEQENTLSFITYKKVIYYPVCEKMLLHSISRNSCISNTDYPLWRIASPIIEEKISSEKVQINDIKAKIKLVKEVVCEAAGDADIKVWFSFDAEGKVLGIGASAQSGIEVTFHCKNSKTLSPLA